MADSKYEKVSEKVFDIAYYAKDELLEWLFCLYKDKLPNAKVIKKNDRVVVMLDGEILNITTHGLKYSVY